MLEHLINLFVDGARAANMSPVIVDATVIGPTTLEVTTTDESVFLINVEELDYGADGR